MPSADEGSFAGFLKTVIEGLETALEIALGAKADQDTLRTTGLSAPCPESTRYFPLRRFR